MKKRWAKDVCCRDRVAVDNGRAWKSACKCVQDDVKKLPVCSPDNASVLGVDRALLMSLRYRFYSDPFLGQVDASRYGGENQTVPHRLSAPLALAEKKQSHSRS